MSRLLYEELIERGYNVVPVDARKQPLAPRYRECYDRHCPELAKLFEELRVKRRQTGLALLGRVNPQYPQKILIIIDIDDRKEGLVRRLPEALSEVIWGFCLLLICYKCAGCRM